MAQDWLIDAYFRLTHRFNVISDREVSQLGLESAVSLLQLQARQLKSRVTSHPTYTGKCTLPVTVEHVRKAFHKELRGFDDYDSDSEIQDAFTTLAPRQKLGLSEPSKAIQTV
jgi:hypothetical protein